MGENNNEDSQCIRFLIRCKSKPLWQHYPRCSTDTFLSRQGNTAVMYLCDTLQCTGYERNESQGIMQSSLNYDLYLLPCPSCPQELMHVVF